jgi:CO dehydrogenase/acetyl-CoA synthase gamma subunit (corrinoid Fe-S protein)
MHSTKDAQINAAIDQLDSQEPLVYAATVNSTMLVWRYNISTVA